MLTIDLPKDQEEPLAIAEVASITQRMPPVEAQQKLDQAKAHISRATQIVKEEALPLIDRAINILAEIQDEQGWQELGYASMRQLIQAQIQPLFNLSISQTYRRLNAAKVRHKISHLCDNIDHVPDSQLEAVSKLPSEQWQEVWTEISATAPNGRVTGKHVKAVVDRRQNQQPDESVNYHSLQSDDCNRPLEGFVQPEEEGGADTEEKQNAVPIPHLSDHQIVTIQDSDQFTPQQREHSGCWGVVSHFLESSALVTVGNNTVEYPSGDLEYITAPSANLKEVCDRVTDLWQVPELPPFVQHILRAFYQRKLDFSQETLEFLEVIESFFKNHVDCNRFSQD